jgi:hypothetical protein
MIYKCKEMSLEKALKINDDFTPCPVAEGDELFPNGIFVFNITKLIEYIEKSSDNILLKEVAVSDFFKGFSSINESHMDSVEISKPIILAEISPGSYNLIDGNHRMEKARRLGINSIQAYKLDVSQHIRFLTTKKAYVAYVEYWNSKLKEQRKMRRIYHEKGRTSASTARAKGRRA